MKNNLRNSLLLGIALVVFGYYIMPAQNGARWYAGFLAILLAGAVLRPVYDRKK